MRKWTLYLLEELSCLCCHPSGPKVFWSFLLYGAPKTCSLDLSGKPVSNIYITPALHPVKVATQGIQLSFFIPTFLFFHLLWWNRHSAPFCTLCLQSCAGKESIHTGEAGAAGGREGWQPKFSFITCHYDSIKNNQDFLGLCRHLCWVPCKMNRSRWCGHKLCQKSPMSAIAKTYI